MCRSVPQMPVRWMRILTSLMPTSGSGTSSSQRPGSARLFTRAFTRPRSLAAGGLVARGAGLLAQGGGAARVRRAGAAVVGDVGQVAARHAVTAVAGPLQEGRRFWHALGHAAAAEVLEREGG